MKVDAHLHHQNKSRIRAFYLDGLTGKPIARSGSEAVLSEGPVANVLINRGSFDPAFLLISKDSSSIMEESPPSTIALATSGHTTPPHLSYIDMSHADRIQGWHALLSSGSNVGNSSTAYHNASSTEIACFQPVKADPSWRYLLPEGSRIVGHAFQTNGRT